MNFQEFRVTEAANLGISVEEWDKLWKVANNVQLSSGGVFGYYALLSATEILKKFNVKGDYNVRTKT